MMRMASDSDHSRKVLEMVAQRDDITELQKMIKDKEKSIPLLQEQINFCNLALDVFQKELEKKQQ